LPKNLLSAVRQAAKPGTWSEGVRVARAGRVVLVERSSTEVSLRVGGSAGVAAPTVILYLGDDPEWGCNCDSTADPCAHVVAATVALSDNQVAPQACSQDSETAVASADAAPAVATQVPQCLG
jgi:hypothetical protein